MFYKYTIPICWWNYSLYLAVTYFLFNSIMDDFISYAVHLHSKTKLQNYFLLIQKTSRKAEEDLIRADPIWISEKTTLLQSCKVNRLRTAPFKQLSIICVLHHLNKSPLKRVVRNCFFFNRYHSLWLVLFTKIFHFLFSCKLS